LTATDATAQTNIALVPHLPEPTRSQLRQMLANSIAAPTTAELREARLGLLTELIAQGHGDTNSDMYEAVRATRAAAGEHWPSRSQLTRAYGTWLHALDAATTLASDLLPAGAPSDRGRSRVSRRYTRSDLIVAIQRCRLALEEWPTASTYGHWRRVTLRATRQHGTVDAAIPATGVITKRFGTWSRAIAIAKAGDPSRATPLPCRPSS
jgi:hypothetical protein